MLTHRIYYRLKPLIPRRLQIALRRYWIKKKLRACENIWPIDERAGKPPKGWTGWPGDKKFALVLTHDVDTAKGQEKCKLLMELEKNLGFRSSFNFVPRRYDVQADLRQALTKDGFEVGVHGLYHDGRYYESEGKFRERAVLINNYLKEWGSVGFRSPSMHRNLEWIHYLNIEYDASTFDTDPFEPQPDGVGTIFPFWVPAACNPKPATHNQELVTRNPEPVTGLHGGYVELPYTLPQDFTLFILMKERNIDIWKRKLDWIVLNGGMALLNTHPDYMNFDRKNLAVEEYPAESYEEFLQYIRNKYGGMYWNMPPKDIALFWKENFSNKHGVSG